MHNEYGIKTALKRWYDWLPDEAKENISLEYYASVVFNETVARHGPAWMIGGYFPKEMKEERGLNYTVETTILDREGDYHATRAKDDGTIWCASIKLRKIMQDTTKGSRPVQGASAYTADPIAIEYDELFNKSGELCIPMDVLHTYHQLWPPYYPGLFLGEEPNL